MNATTPAAHLDNYQGREPSAHIATALNRHGRTERGFPVYRLVDSASVIERVGGLWNDWDSNLNEQDRGGMVFNEDQATQRETLRPVSFRPTRIVAEIRDVPKYSHLDEQGWILERWYPAMFFGTPEMYETLLVPTTTVPRFPQFPHSGQYELVTGIFEQEPSLSFLEDFIAGWEEHRASFPENIAKHVRQRDQQARAAEDRRCRKAREENHYRLTHDINSLNASTSLESGRWRQKAARRAGLTAHVGN